MAKLVWPESVTIPNKIGAGMYFNSKGDPYCAIGHCRYNKIPENDFRKAYKICAGSIMDTGFKSAAVVSDNLRPNLRLLVYNLTCAYLGYTQGQSRNTLKRLKELKLDTEKNS